jgi:hypothetical protein
MKNISQFIGKRQRLLIVLITIISILYFAYGVWSIVLEHMSVGDTDIQIPNFDTISSYFKL